MGQYHLVVNLDKREYLHPHQLGDGLKLMEQAMSGPGGTGSALLLLLAVSNDETGRGGGDFHVAGFSDVIGRWGGDRIALVGDYAEPQDLAEGDDAELIYNLCHDEEGVKSAIDWWRNSSFTDDPKTKAEYAAKADRLEAAAPYTNITPRVREALEAERYIKYSGDGWMERTYGDGGEVSKSLRPDIVVGLGG